MSQLEAAHKKLKEIREKKDLKIRPTKHLKTTFTDFTGVEKPLVIRYYQVQGILHLVVMKRFILGDDTGLGKSLEQLSALTYIWEKEPDRKAIIITTKSSQPQWIQEIAKFTHGVRAISCAGSPEQRKKARQLFESSTGPVVMVMGYRSAVQDFTAMQNYKDHILVLDEVSAIKNPATQVHQVCKHLSASADRVYGLTATLLKNNLMEGYGIYQVVVPALFQMSRNAFMMYYCITQMQSIPGRGNRQIPVIKGYTPEKIKEFRDTIDPYYLGRAKHTVASDLPVLSLKELEVQLTPLQEAKYNEALAGLLQMGDKQGGVQDKEISKLTAIIYCQQIINHPLLIDVAGESPKLEALIEFLSEGDFAEEKVIVYSRFKTMIDITMARLKKEKIPAVRITGDENTKERDTAMRAFQNPDSDIRVICITTAGSEALNLQAAKALVCFDSPFSAGEFIQLVGRMIRIGSIHDRCLVLRLVAKGKKKTVDHRVLEILNKKMALFEAVLGKRLKGEGDATALVEQENDISDLFDSLKRDAMEAKREAK